MEWITDKKPEDIYKINYNNSVEAVVSYMPLILVKNKYYINDQKREKALFKRVKGIKNYHWVYADDEENNIYDEQVIAWFPIPKYEEGGSNVSRKNQ